MIVVMSSMPAVRMGLAALVVVIMLAGVVGLSAAWQRMDDVSSACANVFEEQKTELTGYRWGWLPPAWICTYGDGDERRLPLLQR